MSLTSGWDKYFEASAALAAGACALSALCWHPAVNKAIAKGRVPSNIRRVRGISLSFMFRS
jgi:hypothetical protein